jgi:hypothetical protein
MGCVIVIPARAQRDYLSLGTATMWNWLEEKLLRSDRT